MKNPSAAVHHSLLTNARSSAIMKILALTAEHRAVLHGSAYQRTQDKLFRLLFDCVFEEA